MLDVHIITKQNYKTGGEHLKLPIGQNFWVNPFSKSIGVYNDKDNHLIRSFTPGDILVIHPLLYINQDEYQLADEESYKIFPRHKYLDVYYGHEKERIFSVDHIIYQHKMDPLKDGVSTFFDVYYEDYTHTHILVKRKRLGSDLIQDLYTYKRKKAV